MQTIQTDLGTVLTRTNKRTYDILYLTSMTRRKQYVTRHFTTIIYYLVHMKSISTYSTQCVYSPVYHAINIRASSEARLAHTRGQKLIKRYAELSQLSAKYPTVLRAIVNLSDRAVNLNPDVERTANACNFKVHDTLNLYH